MPKPSGWWKPPCKKTPTSDSKPPTKCYLQLILPSILRTQAALAYLQQSFLQGHNLCKQSTPQFHPTPSIPQETVGPEKSNRKLLFGAGIIGVIIIFFAAITLRGVMNPPNPTVIPTVLPSATIAQNILVEENTPSPTIAPTETSPPPTNTSIPPTNTSIPPTNTPKPIVVLEPGTILASNQTSSGTDTCGNTVSYSPENLIDSDETTAWRTDGDGTGASTFVNFKEEITLTSFQILPGYNKQDPCTPDINWCLYNHIPRSVRLETREGDSVDLILDNECTWQAFDIGPWETRSLEITILSSYPRREDHPAERTAISEFLFFGR